MKRHELPTLLVVATPLGNLGDLTARARDALERTSLVFCEDTRRTRELYAALGLRTPRLERLDEHASPGALLQAVAQLQEAGGAVVVSDAGTPGVSDPGAALVAACIEAEVRVEPLPGPSAVSALIAVLGWRSQAKGYCFHEFFPRAEKEQRAALIQLQTEIPSVHVWFESPQRIEDALVSIAGSLPAARVVAAKEMTKRFERFFRGTAVEVATQVREEIEREGRLGEWVFAVEVPARDAGSESGAESWNLALECLIEGGVGASDASRLIRQKFGVSKNTAYSQAILLSERKKTGGA